LLIILSLDNTGGRGEDTYTQQHLGQSGYEYGTSTVGGGQTGTGPGGTETSGQYGGPERVTTTQTAGYEDPARNVAGAGGTRREDDDEYGASVGPGGGPTGKPSLTSKVKGTSFSSMLWSCALAQTDWGI